MSLVSCILPTLNRAAFIPQAIRSFQSQTYAEKELVILDNGEDGTDSLIPDDPTIKYERVAGKRSVGEMRNLAIRLSEGDIICHFDSDDWSAPGRVTDQVTRLGQFGVVTGYHEMLFYDERTGQAYMWRIPSNTPVRYVLGTSLCYRREWWQHHHFPLMQVGEDIKFFQQAYREAHRLTTSVPSGGIMVARIHGGQTCQKSLNPISYTPMPSKVLPQGFQCVSTLSAT